jgi:hypothetical protein
MRIISQDGKIDVNYKKMVIYTEKVTLNKTIKGNPDAVMQELKQDKRISYKEHRVIAHKTCDEYWILGKYPTEQRALEVMAEINEMWQGEKQELIDTNGDTVRTVYLNLVYQMPQATE